MNKEENKKENKEEIREEPNKIYAVLEENRKDKIILENHKRIETF